MSNGTCPRTASVAPSETCGSVGARVALWSQRVQESQTKSPPLPLDGATRRRTRSARFKTQPVTYEEVAHAHALNARQLPSTSPPPTQISNSEISPSSSQEDGAGIGTVCKKYLRIFKENIKILYYMD